MSRDINSAIPGSELYVLEIFLEKILAVVSNENRVSLIRCFFLLKFQNIILPVANSGVIRKIIFEIQYNFWGVRLFCLT